MDIKKHIQDSVNVKMDILNDGKMIDDINFISLAIASTMKKKNKLMLCGNGGSAADCQHIAAEFTSTLDHNNPRPGLPAIALTTDTSFITANANDFGFEHIFERQVQALGLSGDILIGISTSGNSENIVKAFSYARDHNIKCVALTGGTGGKMLALVDYAIVVPSSKTQYIQESHIMIGHIICEIVENQFPQNS